MLRIGLTGGIGSGKSVVANEFRRLGVPIIDTDEIARELVRPGTETLADITRLFGAEILNADGSLDRAKLRRIVFADERRRRSLEAVLHPRIRTEVARQEAALTAPYCVVVIPLLVENGSDYELDQVLVVDAPDEVRIERLMRHRGFSRVEIAIIMAAQATREQRLTLADDVLENNGTLTQLSQKVEHLHSKYLDASNRTLLA